MLDASVSGSLMAKSTEDAIEIIEKMTLNDHLGQQNINPSYKKSGIIELNTNDVILAHNKLLKQIVDKMTKPLSKLP